MSQSLSNNSLISRYKGFKLALDQARREARIKELLKADIVPAINKAIIEITGSKKYRVPKSKAPLIVKYSIVFDDYNNIDFDSLNTEETRIQVKALLAHLAEISAETKAGALHKDPLDFLIHYLYSRTQLSKEEKLLTQTRFEFYRTAATAIARDSYEAGNANAVKKIFEDLSKEEFGVFFQHTAKVVKQIRYLAKMHNRITPSVIDRYVDAYFTMSGHMEKIARFLMAVALIMENRPANYHDLQNATFANNLTQLRRRPHYSDLLEPIEVTIRNAIAHASVLKDPNSQTITFTDSGHPPITLSYTDFVQKTREVAAVLIICSNVDTIMMYHAALDVKDFLR